MKSAAQLPFALLLASAALTAQTAGQQPPQVTVFHVPTIAIGCPVSLRAQHGPGGDILKIDKNRPTGVAQLLHLTLVNPDSRQIVSAKLTAHGLSGKVRVTQAMQGQNDSDATLSLQATFSPGEGKQAVSDLWVPGMTTVLSIDLDSVTYADGSTRSFAPRDACHVTPDPKMLIGSR